MRKNTEFAKIMLTSAKGRPLEPGGVNKAAREIRNLFDIACPDLELSVRMLTKESSIAVYCPQDIGYQVLSSIIPETTKMGFTTKIKVIESEPVILERSDNLSMIPVMHQLPETNDEEEKLQERIRLLTIANQKLGTTLETSQATIRQKNASLEELTNNNQELSAQNILVEGILLGSPVRALYESVKGLSPMKNYVDTFYSDGNDAWEKFMQIDTFRNEALSLVVDRTLTYELIDFEDFVRIKVPVLLGDGSAGGYVITKAIGAHMQTVNNVVGTQFEMIEDGDLFQYYESDTVFKTHEVPLARIKNCLINYRSYNPLIRTQTRKGLKLDLQ